LSVVSQAQLLLIFDTSKEHKVINYSTVVKFCFADSR